MSEARQFAEQLAQASMDRHREQFEKKLAMEKEIAGQISDALYHQYKDHDVSFRELRSPYNERFAHVTFLIDGYEYKISVQRLERSESEGEAI
jgi:hypothetical protein